MITDEKERKMATEYDKGRIRNNKKRWEYQNQKGESPAPRKAYNLIEHLHNENKRPISGRANPGSSESDLVSVCVKGKARADNSA